MAIWIEFSQPIKKTIKAESASFNVNSRPTAGGGFRHVAQLEDFLFSKYNDNLSAVLVSYLFKGETIPSVSVRFSKLITDKPLVIYKLDNAIIASMSLSQAHSGEGSLESYSLLFEKYKASYS